MFQNLLANFLTSGLLMKHNLDWHRRLLVISIPLFIIFMIIQAEYIVKRIKKY